MFPSYYQARYVEQDGVKILFIGLDTWRLKGGDALLGHDPKTKRTWLRSHAAVRKAIEEGDIPQRVAEYLISKYPHDPNAVASSDEEQLKWLQTTLSHPDAQNCDWRIVTGHFPIHSATLKEHGDTPELISQLDPILRKYNVDAYFSGHDHVLQIIKRKGALTYYGSGAGAKRHTEMNIFYPGLKQHMASYFGFMVHELTKTTMTTTLVASVGKDLGGEKSYYSKYIQQKVVDEVLVTES